MIKSAIGGTTEVVLSDVRAIFANVLEFQLTGDPAMSKSKDQKKMTKKEPAKSPKEKKDAKKLKKEEKKRL